MSPSFMLNFIPYSFKLELAKLVYVHEPKKVGSDHISI